MAAVITGCDTAVTQKGHADRVFINSRIYTGNIDQPWAEAIALEGKNIVYVGDATGASSFVCDSSATIDLDGRLMMPGFVSTHELTERGKETYTVKVIKHLLLMTISGLLLLAGTSNAADFWPLE